MIVIEYNKKPCSINKRYYKNFSLTNEYRAFKDELGFLAKSASRNDANTPYKRTSSVWCNIKVVYKGREPDVDAYIKPALDSLTGIVWDDDVVVKHLIVSKEKGKDDYLRIIVDILKIGGDLT